MAGESSDKAAAAPTEQLENLQLDEVTGEKVCCCLWLTVYCHEGRETLTLTLSAPTTHRSPSPSSRGARSSARRRRRRPRRPPLRLPSLLPRRRRMTRRRWTLACTTRIDPRLSRPSSSPTRQTPTPTSSTSPTTISSSSRITNISRYARAPVVRRQEAEANRQKLINLRT